MILDRPILAMTLSRPVARNWLVKLMLKNRPLWFVTNVPFCALLWPLILIYFGICFWLRITQLYYEPVRRSTQSAFFCYLSLPPLLTVMGFPRKVVRRRALANTWQAEPRVRPIVCRNLHYCDWQDINTPGVECSALVLKFSMETTWLMAYSVTVVFVDSHVTSAPISRLWIRSAKLPA